jgi:hypothetical protein
MLGSRAFGRLGRSPYYPEPTARYPLGLDNTLAAQASAQELIESVQSCGVVMLRYRDEIRPRGLPPHDRARLVFDRAAWNHLKYQLDCPFHPKRLTHPTTLHTLVRYPS